MDETVARPDAIALVRWRSGERQTGWHAEHPADRWGTACGLKVPGDVPVRRRLASVGHWPTMCDGCKVAILRGRP